MKPRLELEPFFGLSYECHAKDIAGDPGGDRDQMQYLDSGFYPVQAPYPLYARWRGKLSTSLWLEVSKQHNIESLQRLAKEYGVSYEAIRRTLVAASKGESELP